MRILRCSCALMASFDKNSPSPVQPERPVLPVPSSSRKTGRMSAWNVCTMLSCTRMPDMAYSMKPIFAFSSPGFFVCGILMTCSQAGRV
jgi:hypothetical protein